MNPYKSAAIGCCLISLVLNPATILSSGDKKITTSCSGCLLKTIRRNCGSRKRRCATLLFCTVPLQQLSRQCHKCGLLTLIGRRSKLYNCNCALLMISRDQPISRKTVTFRGGFSKKGHMSRKFSGRLFVHS